MNMVKEMMKQFGMMLIPVLLINAVIIAGVVWLIVVILRAMKVID